LHVGRAAVCLSIRIALLYGTSRRFFVARLVGADDDGGGHRRRAGGAPREAAFIDSTFVTMCTIERFRTGLASQWTPASRELKQRDQAPLPAGVAVNIALRHLYRLVCARPAVARLATGGASLAASGDDHVNLSSE
jgi:hypothetical protein